MNVLKAHLRITITTPLARGASQHEIAQRTGVDRKTIRHYAWAAEAPAANAPRVATGLGRDHSSALIAHCEVRGTATSACERNRAWIETQVALGWNAVSVRRIWSISTASRTSTSR